MSSDPKVLARMLERERGARRQAERLLESKSREVFAAAEALRHLNEQLERKVAQRTQALDQARMQLEALIHHLPFAVLAEDEERNVIAANRAFIELFGLRTEAGLRATDWSIAEQHAAALFEAPEQYRTRAQELVHRNQEIRGERLRLADGRVLERDHVPLGEDKPRGRLWQFRDVTAQVADADALARKRDDAERASEAKSDFMTMLSHDMRTPLSVVLGMTDLLTSTNLTAEQSDYSRRIRASVESLMQLLESLLEFAKLRDGRIEVAARPFEPLQALEEVAEQLAPKAHAKGLEVVVDVDPACPRTLVGDELRLMQVLANLVGNSIKFSHRDAVTLRATLVEQDDERAAVRYEVVDRGEGIPESEQERIFGRFERGDAGESDRSGVGLGLDICRGLVALMGGEIELDSKVGQGSCFSFVLQHTTTEGSTTEPARDLDQVVVVVVDDVADTRQALKSMLSQLGAEVHLVAEPEQLDQPLGAVPRADVVVYDDRFLPGGAVLERLQGHEKLAPATMVALSAGGAVDAQALRRAGVAAMLTKPVRQAALRKAIATALDRGPVAAGDASTIPRLETGQPRLRCLIVEDDADNRAYVRRALERNGFQTELAHDGATGLAKAQRLDLDLIVSDIWMPELDGLDMVSRLRDWERATDARRTPAVIVSADALAETRARAIKVGVDAFLTKPVSMKDLARTARQCADDRPVVLVVDDSAEMRDLVKRQLGAIGPMRVLEADRGSNALPQLRRSRVSMLLVDMEMPGMSGAELAAEVRSLRGSQLLPIIVAMTGHDDPASQRLLVDAGCDVFLAKPFTGTRLRETLEPFLAAIGMQVDGDDAEATIPLHPPATIGDDIADLLPGYLDRRERDVARMAALLEAGAFGDIESMGHRLRGSGTSYGLRGVSAIGSQIEEAAKRRETAALRELAEALAQEVANARAAAANGSD
jgi:signal transduction histidine kinase/CheY-like chemotaxis protein